jgi:hypothetical protein
MCDRLLRRLNALRLDWRSSAAAKEVAWKFAVLAQNPGQL